MRSIVFAFSAILFTIFVKNGDYHTRFRIKYIHGLSIVVENNCTCEVYVLR